MVKKLPMLNLILAYLNTAGLNPTKQNFLSHALKLLCVISIGEIFIINLMEPILNWNGIQTVTKIEMMPVLFMIVVKWICFVLKNKDLHSILNKLDELWPLNQHGADVEAQIMKYHKRINFVIKYYFSMFMVTFFAMAVAPFITNKKSLLYEGYELCDLEISPCFEAQYAFQILTIGLQVFPIVFPFDTLFMQFITYGYCALENLKYGLKQISELNQFEGNRRFVDAMIKNIVLQHNVILEYIKLLNGFYKDMLLAQFCTSLGSLIFNLFMMTYEGIPPKLSALSKYGVIFVTLVMQLFLYCIGGAFLMDQTKTVADEAYDVNWSIRTQPELRRQLVFIIQRSHRAEKLSIGKMQELNLRAFISVMKNSLSVYTLLLNLESKSKID